MTATNHALTGAVIATVISVPIIALPLAFSSHFVLDVLPHFGEKPGKRKRLSKSVWSVDVILLIFFLLILAFTSNWLALLGAVLAISPDFAWIYKFMVDERFGSLPPKPENRFNSFHSGIQKYETRRGIVFEIVWFVLLSSILIKIL